MNSQMMFQRRMLGILCALLPPTCILFGLLGDNLPYWYCSISATYYANSKICMIGLLFATSVFFFSYRGYDWRDVTLSLIQAVACLGIIVFPCKTAGVSGRVGLLSLDVGLSNVFHCVSASVLFVAFGLNISFLFTLGDDGNYRKCQRNMVYKICGAVILGFCALQAMSGTYDIPDWFPLTMINETVMLEAFAVAWLTKSGMFFPDI